MQHEEVTDVSLDSHGYGTIVVPSELHSACLMETLKVISITPNNFSPVLHKATYAGNLGTVLVIVCPGLNGAVPTRAVVTYVATYKWSPPPFARFSEETYKANLEFYTQAHEPTT